VRWRILNRMLRVTARLACLFAIPRVGPRGLKSLFAVLTLVSVSPRVMGGDPVAWWVADDFSTGSANWVDRIGKKVAVSYGQLNNAQGVAFDNGPVKATGQFRGGAASAGIVLDGVNDYFEVTADNNPVAGQKTVTIVALFKASQPSTGIDGNHWRYPGPINAEAPGAPNDFGLTVGADGKAHGFFNDAIPTTSPVVVVDGLPHTLVLTWSAKDLGNGLTGDGIARFYVDGVLQGSLATDAGSGIVNYGMRFGRDRETTDRWFRGTLGELRFYASIEDPTEIHKTIAGQKQLLVNSEFTSVGQDGVTPSGWSSSAGFVAPCGAYCGGSDTTPAWDGNNLRFGFSPSAIVIQEVSVDGVSSLSRFLLEYEVGNVIVSGLYSVKAEFLDAGRQVLGSIRKPISSWETAPSPATTQSLVLSRSSTTWFSQIASVRISVQGTQGSDSSPSHIWSGHYGPAFGFVRLWAESGKPTAPLLAGKNAPIQVVVDNDYALLAGSPSGPTRVVYQPGTGGLEAQVALGLGASVRMNLLEGESYLYLVAMGGGGREAVEGSINGVNLVSLAVPRGQAAVDPQGAYLNLSPSWTGFSGASVAAGDFSVSLAQVHSALQGAIWGSPASKSIPPLKPELGSSAWPFPSDISVAFRFQATALALVPIPGDRSVSLSWSPPSVDGGTPITDYRIQYSIDGIDWMTFSDGVSATTSSVVTGLINGTAYRFRVAAINDSGVGYDSVESASVRPLGPFAPISLAGAEDQVVSFTPSTFILAFSNGSGPSLYGIRIESLPSTGTLKLFGNLVLAGDFIITADLGQLAYEPAANETGAKTFEVQASDGLSLTAKSVVSVVLAPANDAPSLAAISVSGTEDTTVAFAASNFTSAYSDVEQTALASITVVSLPTSGTLKLSGNAVAAGQVISAQNLANLTYVPAANENGAKTFTVSASDGALSSPTATVTINLAAVNDAPVLGSIGGAAGWSFFTDFSTLHPKATLAGVTKLQNGELVLTEAVNSQYGYMTLEPFSANPSAFVAEFQYRVYDGTGADGVSFNYGQLTRSPGIPEYGTFFPEYGIISPEAGGTTDTGLAVSFIEWEGQRVLVRAYNTTLATIPFDLMSPDYRKVRISVDDAGLVSVSIGGQPVVSQLDLGDTYRLANKTSWQFGFGARTGAANNRHSLDDLHIGPGGLVPDTFTFAEDAPGSIVFPGSPFSDVDSTSLTVTLEVTSGTLTGAEVTGVVVGGSAQARTFAGTPADLNSYFAAPGNITYQSALNASGDTTLIIRLSDGQSTTSTTSVLSITPVNDAPSLAAISLNGTEDTIVALDAALLTSDLFTSAYSDVEQTALVSITVVSLPTSGTLKLSGNAVAAGQVISAQNLANLTYVPAANENGAKTFTVSASDGALSSPTATVTINLAAVNDAPVLGSIGGAAGWSFFTDFSTLHPKATLAGVTKLQNGELVLTEAVNSQYGYMTLEPFSANPSAFVAEFQYRVYDGTGADGVSFNYGQLTRSPGIPEYGTFFPEYGIISPEAGGTTDTGLAVSFIEWEGQRVLVRAYNTTLATIPFDLMSPDYRKVRISVDDAGLVSVSIGGQPVVSQLDLGDTYRLANKTSWQFGFGARTGAANNRHSLDDLHIGPGGLVPDTFTFAEDAPGSIVFPGSPFSDVDSTSLTVTLEVPAGTLSGAEVAGVVVGGSAQARTFAGTVAALNAYFAGSGNITYQGAPNASGNVTLAIRLSDGQSTPSTTSVLSITPVNDAPSLAAISVNGTEDTIVALDAALLTSALFTSAYSDVEQTALASITVVSLPTSGTLELSGNLVVAGQVITAQELANLAYVPAADENGAKTFTVSASDGALSSPTATVTINLAPVNDAPTIAAIAAQTTLEDTATAPIVLSVADSETPAARLTVTASSSNPDVVAASGISLGFGAPSQGLIGRWSFDSADDLGRDLITGESLVKSGSPAWTSSGKLGGALELNGSSWLSASSGTINKLPLGNSTYSVSLWFKARTFGAKGFVGWGDYWQNNNVNAFRLDGDTRIVNYWWANDLSAPVGSTLSPNVWYHAVATYDGTRRSIYLNGQKIGSLVDSRADVQPLNFGIGKTYGSEYFDGWLDEVAIYDRALSDTEVAQLAQVASNDRTITVTPVPNASGTSTITVTATDEANATATTAFTVTVGAVNDAPLFTSVNPLTGGIEDTDFTISCEALAAAADESDVDSTNLQFRIESVSSGTLTLGGVPVTAGSTLLAAGQSLVWRPAPDANGLIEALKVKAWDGQLHSAVAVPVMVSVAAVADPVTIEGLVGVSRAYDGTRIASATGTPVLKGVADGADVNLTGTPVFTFAQAGVSDSAVSIAVSGYTLTGAQAQDYVLTQPTLSASITSRAVAVGGLSGVDKVYDGTTVATASGTATLAGVLQGDTVTMTGTPVFTFAGSKVGAGITIATTGYGLSGGQAGNYSLTQPTLSANITPKPLTVIGLTANNKIYDGTTAATVSGTASLSGIVSGDESKVTLTGTPAYAFKNANLGNGTPVTTTGFSLSGDLAGNYGLTQPTLSANITTDGLVGGQLIAFSQSLIQIAAYGQFTIKQSSQLPAGALVERVVFSFEYSTYWNWNAVAENYAQLNGVDLPGAGWTSLGTGSGWKAQTTVYQGTLPSFNRSGDNLWLLGSAWNPVSIRNAKMTIYYWLPGKLSQTLTFGPLANVAYGADDVPLSASASSGLPVAWEVASGPGRISGSSLVVQAAGSIVIRASQAGDAVWFAAEPVERTLVVGKKAISLVGVTAMDKVYDGTASARLAFSGAALSGIVSGDAGAVALDSVSASASFGSPAAGDNKPVTVNRLDLSGTAAGNYSLILPTLSANITPKPLKVTGLIADNKTYDRTTAATVSGTASLVGVITGDAVSLAGTPVLQFASANVGTGIAITASGYALSGNQAGNYTLTQLTGLTANITGKALTISGAMVANKVYDGTTVATVSFAGANLSGVLANDEVSLSAKDAIGTFADAGVGLRKPVTVTGLSLSGNAAGNYTLGTPSGLKADITAKTLSLVGLGGSDKIYDGTVAATVSGTGSLSGLILGDGVSLSGTPVFSFSSANVGTGIPITITGYALSGIHAANYTLTMPILSASITPKALTLKVLAASRAYRASNPSFEFEAFASQLVAGETMAQVIGGNGAASDLVYRLAGTTVASAVGVYRSEIRVDPASIDGSKASNYAVTVVSGDLTITPAALTITLDAGSLAQSFTGTPRSVTWSTQPSGVAAKATYNGSPNPPVVAGTYAVVVQSEDANYAGQVSGVLLIRSTLEALKSESFLMAAGLMPVTGGEGRYRLEASLGQTFAGAVPVVTGIQVEAGFWFTGRLSEALSPAGVQVPSAEVAAKGIAVLATTSSTGSSVDPSQAASVRDPQMASGIRLPEARLTVSPSPESLRVRIQVSGISGAQWKVQYLDGLRSGGWQDAGLLRLDSEGMGVIETDAVEDSAMRFYRLVQP